MTAAEIEPGAHDGSASPTVFSVLVRSHVREVLHSPVRLTRVSEARSQCARGFREILVGFSSTDGYVN